MPRSEDVGTFISSPLSSIIGGTTASIITALAAEWPLSARQIYSKVADNNKITYQGVHKTLGKLENEGVLRKVGRSYSLDENWVSELKSFGDAVQASYLKKSPVSIADLRSKDIVNLRFDSLMSLAHFVLDLLYDNYKHAKEPYVGVAHWRRCWITLFFSGKDYQKLREFMANRPRFILVNNNSVVDNFLANNFRSMGANVKCGVNCATECDLFGESDFLCRVYFPKSLNESLNNFYNKTVSAELINIKNYYDLIHLSSPIRVSITRDPEITGRVVDETLDYFGTNFNDVIKKS